MYQLSQTSRFKKDIKLAIKRGLDMRLLDNVVTHLAQNGMLPSTYKSHRLKGDYVNFWECHIQPDWLLIWSQDELEKIIILTRTGTHSDLF